MPDLQDTPDLGPFIIDQLAKHGVHVVDSGPYQTNLKAYCFKGHDHKTPSLSIRRMDGAFYCFGCGVKGRNWNAISNYLNVETLGEDELPDPFMVMSYTLEKQYQQAFLNIEIPWNVEPWEGPWRGIREDTLKRVGAFRWFDDDQRILADRILFPIMMYEKVKGWVARRTDKPEPGEKFIMPYRNADYMKSKELLFPFDSVCEMRNRSVIVLVEGPYDALRLVNYGIPALSILGTNNYDPGNRVHLLNAGAKSIIIAMDGDESGENARYAIAPSLRELFTVKHFLPPQGEDPGSMSADNLRYLLETVKKLRG